MSYKDGDEAFPWDVWHRIVTSDDHWRKRDGTLHNRAFGGKAIAKPEVARPWSHELSGRLLSVVSNIEESSNEFCKKLNRPFVGVMFESAEKLKDKIDGTFPCCTFYTPYPEDKTHSDFATFSTKTEEDLQSVRDWLQRTVRFVRPDKLDEVRALLKKPDDNPGAERSSSA
jgi:hypothetical protein